MDDSKTFLAACALAALLIGFLTAKGCEYQTAAMRYRAGEAYHTCVRTCGEP